jgi:hypothetical protein
VIHRGGRRLALDDEAAAVEVDEDRELLGMDVGAGVVGDVETGEDPGGAVDEDVLEVTPVAASKPGGVVSVPESRSARPSS